MCASNDHHPGPTAAEQVRSILARAASAHVEQACRHRAASGSHGPTEWLAVGPLLLEPEPLRTGVATTTVRVEIADPAPLPVRSRIRARVELWGAAEATTLPAGHPLRLHPEQVVLHHDGVRVPVAPVDLLAAEPDPLAAGEAGLLTHLDTAHPELVEALGWLLPEAVRQGAVRVWPLLLDRRGLVLRIEHASRHRDLRLRFAASASTPTQVRREVGVLLAAAHAARARCRRRRLLGDLQRVAPYAQRLARPETWGPEGPGPGQR